MSLMQLLSVGHSFVGIKDVPSRYKLAENWLPKFGPLEPLPAGPAASPARTASEPSALLRPPPKTPAAPMGVGTPAGAIDPPGATVAAPVSGRTLRSGGRRREQHALRHPELCLERVRVVRNDLSDTDLEIIPVACKSATVVEPPAAPAAADPTVAAGWGQLAARLFNAGRALF